MRSNKVNYVVAMLLISSTCALAQDRGWFEEVKSDDGQVLFNINFPGGSAHDYEVELAAFGREHFNIIIVDDVRDVHVPQIEVARVDQSSLFSLPYSLTGKMFAFLPQNRSVRMKGGAVAIDPEPSAFETYLVKRMDSNGNIPLPDRSRLAGPHSDRFDISFAGGSLLDYIQSIRGAAPNANIVGMPGIENAILPPIKLKGMTVRAAIEPLKGQVVRVDGQLVEIDVSVWSGGSSESDEIITVSVDLRQEEVSTKIWSVGSILDDGVGEEDLLSAVRAALDLNQQEATVRFHPETRLLMIRGLPESVITANETLHQVERSARASVQAGNHWADQNTIEDFRARIVELERKLGLRDD